MRGVAEPLYSSTLPQRFLGQLAGEPPARALTTLYLSIAEFESDIYVTDLEW